MFILKFCTKTRDEDRVIAYHVYFCYMLVWWTISSMLAINVNFFFFFCRVSWGCAMSSHKFAEQIRKLEEEGAKLLAATHTLGGKKHFQSFWKSKEKNAYTNILVNGWRHKNCKHERADVSIRAGQPALAGKKSGSAGPKGRLNFRGDYFYFIWSEAKLSNVSDILQNV